MTRDQLKERLTIVVCDSTLSKEERDRILVPIAQEWLKACESTDLDYPGAFNMWNNVMAEIVEEHDLRRH